jgi:hypothetical protein
MTAAVGIYCISVGVLMLGWWAVELRGGVLSRPDRKPAEIGLHLAAELLTAGWLVAAGAALLAAGAGAIPFAAAGLGMLLYTVVQSPGYFIARREPAPVAMFVVLVALTVAALAVLLLAA